ncbi:hypothetical protein J6590_076366 [Homalodisca vitripennis]|nr:hypothetical protein J6590_076366 [Homalodisca vitripennis]
MRTVYAEHNLVLKSSPMRTVYAEHNLVLKSSPMRTVYAEHNLVLKSSPMRTIYTEHNLVLKSFPMRTVYAEHNLVLKSSPMRTVYAEHILVVKSSPMRTIYTEHSVFHSLAESTSLTDNEQSVRFSMTSNSTGAAATRRIGSPYDIRCQLGLNFWEITAEGAILGLLLMNPASVCSAGYLITIHKE